MTDHRHRQFPYRPLPLLARVWITAALFGAVVGALTWLLVVVL